MENRIENRVEQEEDATDLEDVRDELLFALESSGVEQFQLEVNSDYRGQEKLAEAIKEKEACEKPEKAGRIAKVVRPGYRYMIDDESYKVVRTAQVKLFG
jgi:molecular chaperone GrpE (heat shock protein)